jgi:hypothetical protein
MSHQYADKYCHQLDDIPKVPHFVIMSGTSVTIPGDERSRTNPGHGYPESTNHYLDYEAYLTEEKWKEQIAYLVKEHRRFKAFKVFPAEIKTEVNVEIKV